MAEGNPTPTTEDEAYISLEEEVADVITVLGVLSHTGFEYPEGRVMYKLSRWAKRIGGENV